MQFDVRGSETKASVSLWRKGIQLVGRNEKWRKRGLPPSLGSGASESIIRRGVRFERRQRSSSSNDDDDERRFAREWRQSQCRNARTASLLASSAAEMDANYLRGTHSPEGQLQIVSRSAVRIPSTLHTCTRRRHVQEIDRKLLTIILLILLWVPCAMTHTMPTFTIKNSLFGL
jgi:hypothetical protein